jgi:hypothetical protein
MTPGPAINSTSIFDNPIMPWVLVALMMMSGIGGAFLLLHT